MGSVLRCLWPKIWAVLSVPVVTLTLLQVVSGDLWEEGRPTAALGNPNYLAAWLGFALLSLLFSPPTSPAQSRWAAWGAGLLSLLLALNLSGSRAGLVSVGASLALTACAAPLLGLPRLSKRQLGVILAGVTAVGLLAAFSAGQRLLGSLRNLTDVNLDEARLGYYEVGVDLVERMPEALLDEQQRPDAWAALRPWIGYGLDNLDALHWRTYPTMEAINAQVYLDRLHNLGFDTLLMTGWVGLALNIALFQVALWACLRPLIPLPWPRLRLLLAWELGAVVIWQVLGSMLGLGLGLRWSLAPLAALAGVGAWLLERARRGERRASGWTAARWPLLLLALSVHHLVNNAFGFPVLVTWPAWWITLGLIVHQAGPQAEEQRAAAHPWAPVGLGLGVLLLVLISGLRSIDAGLLATWWGASALLLGLLGWGLGLRPAWPRLAVYGGLIAAYGLLNDPLRNAVSESLVAVLLQAPQVQTSELAWVAQGFAWWRLVGYGLVLACLIAWPLNWRSWTRAGQLATLALLTAACLAYAASHGSSVLQRTEQALSSAPNAVHARLLALEAACRLTPWNVDRRLSLVQLQRALSLDDRTDLEALLRLDPYAWRRPNSLGG
jgi:hypothetical protein